MAHIAVVSQDTWLFNATLRSNIVYGLNKNISDEVLADVAKKARLYDFIMSLPDKFDTRIGDKGVKLSGGERQRVAIARAILANPRILVMDDATASVDSATERLIQAALIELTRNRTTFVIAHRISTVRRADRIVVIESGKIVETGRHEELLAAGGVYRDVYDIQLAEALEK